MFRGGCLGPPTEQLWGQVTATPQQHPDSGLFLPALCSLVQLSCFLEPSPVGAPSIAQKWESTHESFGGEAGVAVAVWGALGGALESSWMLEAAEPVVPDRGLAKSLGGM